MSVLFFLFIQQPKGYAKKTIKQPNLQIQVIPIESYIPYTPL